MIGIVSVLLLEGRYLLTKNPSGETDSVPSGTISTITWGSGPIKFWVTINGYLLYHRKLWTPSLPVGRELLLQGFILNSVKTVRGTLWR